MEREEEPGKSEPTMIEVSCLGLLFIAYQAWRYSCHPPVYIISLLNFTTIYFQQLTRSDFIQIFWYSGVGVTPDSTNTNGHAGGRQVVDISTTQIPPTLRQSTTPLPPTLGP